MPVARSSACARTRSASPMVTSKCSPPRSTAVTDPLRTSIPQGQALFDLIRPVRTGVCRRESESREARWRRRYAARPRRRETRRRQRPRMSAALSPAGPPPTITTHVHARPPSDGPRCLGSASARPVSPDSLRGLQLSARMDVADFDFELPEELIAQEPPPERGGSRLLKLSRVPGAPRGRDIRRHSALPRRRRPARPQQHRAYSPPVCSADVTRAAERSSACSSQNGRSSSRSSHKTLRCGRR